MQTQDKALAIYVDKSRRQWIVRDPDGNFWTLPSVENSWEQREPFDLTEHVELEPVPGHYKYLLELPFR